MPSVNENDLLICFSSEASKQIEHAQLILPQLQRHNNSYFLSDVERLTAAERRVWVKFFAPLFYQGQCWIEQEEEKIFIYDQLDELFKLPTQPSKTISNFVVLYQDQSTWVLHHTKKNWVYKTKKNPTDLLTPHKFSLRFGFFENDQEAGAHIVEELFTQYSSLKNENPIIKKYRVDAFEQFPKLNHPISLERAYPEWDMSWQEIRKKRRSSEDKNDDGVSLADLGRILDLSVSADKKDQDRSKRGYPSAGGFYSECILLELDGVDGIETGTYLYHPLEHSLYFVDKSITSNKTITFIIASRIDLLREKYFKISTRLMLLNTGVILHQLNLACAIMGLNGHPHGTIQQYPWSEKLKTIWPSDWKISGRYIIS